MKLACIALIDDSEDDNFIHRRAVRKAGVAESVLCFQDPVLALEQIRSSQITPDLIFLDINMPKMNGWEFLEAYNQLPQDVRTAVVVMMLTTSLNPADRARAQAEHAVGGLCNKPLTAERCREIVDSRLAEARDPQ